MKIYRNDKSKTTVIPKLKHLWTEIRLSQEKLTGQLQLHGIAYNALTVLRIKKGECYVPDYEIVALAKFFHLTTNELLRIRKAEK